MFEYCADVRNIFPGASLNFGRAARIGLDRVSVTTAWLSILGWLALLVIAIALIAGYARFAAFVAQQMVSSVAVLGALYLLFVLARELFVKAPLGQIVAANLGISQRWLVLVKSITASGICLSLTLTVLVSIVGLQYIIR